MNPFARFWIDRLHLRPHPEGGYFKENYQSTQSAIFNQKEGKRRLCTAIYYLLDGRQFSAFHQLKSDELWHHYAGSPLILHLISVKSNQKTSSAKKSPTMRVNKSKGELRNIILGTGIELSEPQVVVPGGTIFAASVLNRKSYSLVGCTMSPGFDKRDWAILRRSELLRMFPHLHKSIDKYSND